jgi:hypothetical protein
MPLAVFIVCSSHRAQQSMTALLASPPNSKDVFRAGKIAILLRGQIPVLKSAHLI